MSSYTVVSVTVYSLIISTFNLGLDSSQSGTVRYPDQGFVDSLGILSNLYVCRVSNHRGGGGPSPR